MRRITTRAHGVLDYVVAVPLIIVSFLFIGEMGGIEQAEALGVAPVAGQVAMWTLVVAGVLWLALSLATDYELGLRPIIPMSAHLGFDVALGLLLIVSPWVLGFDELTWWPHVLVGGLAVTVAAMTDRVPSYY